MCRELSFFLFDISQNWYLIQGELIRLTNNRLKICMGLILNLYQDYYCVIVDDLGLSIIISDFRST